VGVLLVLLERRVGDLLVVRIVLERIGGEREDGAVGAAIRACVDPGAARGR
jgi:hypothetical protein